MGLDTITRQVPAVAPSLFEDWFPWKQAEPCSAYQLTSRSEDGSQGRAFQRPLTDAAAEATDLVCHAASNSAGVWYFKDE